MPPASATNGDQITFCIESAGADTVVQDIEEGNIDDEFVPGGLPRTHVDDPTAWGPSANRVLDPACDGALYNRSDFNQDVVRNCDPLGNLTTDKLYSLGRVRITTELSVDLLHGLDPDADLSFSGMLRQA